MPAYVGNPLAGDPIWEASSASELRIAIARSRELIRPGIHGTSEETASAFPALAVGLGRQRKPAKRQRGEGDARLRCPGGERHRSVSSRAGETSNRLGAL
jgi:hypothetical protein